MTKPNPLKFTLLMAPVLIAAAVAAPSQAQTTGTGVYIEGGVGQVKNKKADADLNTVNAKAGYQFNPYFALEGEAAVGTGKENGVGGTYKLTNKLGAYAVGTVPVNDRLSLIGRVGVSDTQLKRPAGVTAVENGTSKDVGVGAKVKLTDSVALRGDYTHSEFNGNHGRSDQVGLNLVKSF